MEDLKELLSKAKANSTHYVEVKDTTAAVRAISDIQKIVDLKAENAELKKDLAKANKILTDRVVNHAKDLLTRSKGND